MNALYAILAIAVLGAIFIGLPAELNKRNQQNFHSAVMKKLSEDKPQLNSKEYESLTDTEKEVFWKKGGIIK
jgi:hypothetical protein